MSFDLIMEAVHIDIIDSSGNFDTSPDGNWVEPGVPSLTMMEGPVEAVHVDIIEAFGTFQIRHLGKHRKRM